LIQNSIVQDREQEKDSKIQEKDSSNNISKLNQTEYNKTLQLKGLSDVNEHVPS